MATLPGRGLYARHLGHPEGVDAVYRTTVGLPGSAPRPASFDRSWLEAGLDTVDVVHVHGLRPGQSPAEVAAAADAVRASGTPLVVTGYHLSDPTGASPEVYTAQLDALVTRADAVVTLTQSAAEEMRLRWGVEPQVLPHPHVVDFVRMRRPRPQRNSELRVGTHLAALCMPSDPVRFVTGLTQAVRGMVDVRLSVHVHETVLDPGSSTYDLATLREIDRLVRSAHGALRVHRPFSEAQLWDHLFALDVSVVPGLFGSHSIWPEACTDLGTQPVLRSGSHASAQQPCLVFEDEGSVDDLADSFGKALWTAREQGSIWRADPGARWAERVRVAEALRELYERLLGLDRP
ncbi:MAG TPA: glycosyltransferase [Kineosporiaceae bacterium]|nr:glycosyltransferase [Kineosporiaceae bacterium]